MSQLLASDDRNTEFAGARNPDDVLHVTFYSRATKHNAQSEIDGKPTFINEEFVRIMIPGRTDTIIDEPVREEHKRRFPRQWMVYKNVQSEADQTIGTPVTEWAALDKAMAEELKAKRFYTVEQVASCSDGQIQALGMNGNILRQKARAFLQQASDTALAQRQAAEIERKQKEMDDLRASIPSMVADAVAQALAQAQPQKKKPGRKPKVQVEMQPGA